MTSINIKHRSQGSNIKAQVVDDRQSYNATASTIYPYPVRDLLDDVALVVSGPGGADNVSSASLEVRSIEDRILVLRVTRNAGINTDHLRELGDLLHTITEAYKAGSSREEVRSIVLEYIVRNGRARFKKHILALHRILTDAFQGEEAAGSATNVNEKEVCDIQDFDNLEEPTQTTAMERQRNCLLEIKRLTAKAAQSFHSTKLEDFKDLIERTYEIQKSAQPSRLIDQWVNQARHPRSSVDRVKEIRERLGQLSKFARATSTITSHLGKMHRLDVKLEIACAPSRTIKVPELSVRTANDLRNRGGKRFAKYKHTHLQGMLRRWPTYREHAEMQLIMFYEENPDLNLHSTYIGCSKQSCFLCFSFITQHGRFQVSGCHQSLYSLWAIRLSVKVDTPEAVEPINRCLAHLAETVNQKVESLRCPTWKGFGGGSGKESIANLSRTSFAFSFDSHIDALPRTTQAIDGIVDVDIPVSALPKESLTLSEATSLQALSEAVESLPEPEGHAENQNPISEILDTQYVTQINSPEHRSSSPQGRRMEHNNPATPYASTYQARKKHRRAQQERNNAQTLKKITASAANRVIFFLLSCLFGSDISARWKRDVSNTIQKQECSGGRKKASRRP